MTGQPPIRPLRYHGPGRNDPNKKQNELMDHKKEIIAIIRDCIADGLINEVKLGDFKKTVKKLDTPATQGELEDYLQPLWDLIPNWM